MEPSSAQFVFSGRLLGNLGRLTASMRVFNLKTTLQKEFLSALSSSLDVVYECMSINGTGGAR